MSNFTFQEKGHRYELDGKPVTGVTSILAVISKPALISWSARMTADWIRENCEKAESLPDLPDQWTVTDIQLHQASEAHTRKKEAGGDKGKDLHALVESYIKARIAGTDFAPTSDPMLLKFIDWSVQNKVKFLESEKRMVSKTLWVAGTCDFTCEMNGKRFLADLKTSGAFYPEHFYQCAAYRLLSEEMGEKYDGSLVVRIDKKTNQLETQERYDYETDKNAFLGALAIYRANATY